MQHATPAVFKLLFRSVEAWHHWHAGIA